MNFKVILKNLLGRFSEAGVEVALSGGLALSTMGVFRFTKDIDFTAFKVAQEQHGHESCAGVLPSIRKGGPSG
jgi:hypothetical protein